MARTPEGRIAIRDHGFVPEADFRALPLRRSSSSIECSPSQIVVTGGFGSGLGLALRVLDLEGRKVWMEDPGFPFTRRGLELAMQR
jgi:DNA-binding transcriptional MocR family regulator